MDKPTDFIATELLRELKEGNARKDKQIVQLTKQYMYTIFGFIILVLIIVVSFLLYLNQYDFTGTDSYTYESNGVYALIDSNGNVIAQDFTQEELESIMEVLDLNGNSEENSYDNSIEGT